MSSDSHNYVSWFRQSSPYINAHRGKTFVLMLPGAAMLEDNFATIIHDIALLNSLGVRLVLVHGARPQIDARLQQSDQPSGFHKTWRVTEASQIPGVCQAIGEVRFNIESALSNGLPNSPMHGAHIKVAGGNFVTAKPLGVLDGIDFQHTGRVRRIDAKALDQTLAQGAIAVISPLGYSPTGEIFNLSFAEIATQIALALRADKLIAFSSTTGFENSSGQLLRQITLDECAQLLKQIDADNDSSQSLQACFDTCQGGIPRSHIISYREDGALLKELFTRDGSGTLVHRGNYEFVRQATIDDVRGLLELIEPLEKQGALVRRSRELLESEISQFTVLEKDRAILACAALYPYYEEGSATTAELACVATHQDYQKGGRAALVLEAIEAKARQQGIKSLFVLTTQAAHWFIEQGFKESHLDTLPSEKKHLYNYQRNSKVFIKTL